MKTLTVDVTGLSDRHIVALERFIAKFRAGALEHGDLKPGKQWTPDMISEQVDTVFYLIFEMLEIEDGKVQTDS